MLYSFAQTGLPLTALHDAMLDAFSDYVTPMQPSLQTFETMIHSRGFDPQLSKVAVDGDQIVAFWNIGIRGAASYLITSGTRPDHRGKGLSTRLGRDVLAAVVAAGCRQITTEVIIGNNNAQALYEKLGLGIRRKLDCCRLTQAGSADVSELLDWTELRPLLSEMETYAPSWQNQNATLDLVRPSGLATDDAVAVFDPQSGVVYRAAGDLSRLLPKMRCFADLTFVNLDAKDRALADHLTQAGASLFLSQNELFLSLKEPAA